MATRVTHTHTKLWTDQDDLWRGQPVPPLFAINVDGIYIRGEQGDHLLRRRRARRDGWVRTTRAPFSPRARDHHPLPPAVAQNGGIAAIGVSYAPTTINIEDSTFTGSSGFTYGGAVTVSTYTTLTISGTLIEKLDAGQALYACCSPLSIFITITDTTFQDNSGVLLLRECFAGATLSPLELYAQGLA